MKRQYIVIQYTSISLNTYSAQHTPKARQARKRPSMWFVTSNATIPPQQFTSNNATITSVTTYEAFV